MRQFHKFAAVALALALAACNDPVDDNADPVTPPPGARPAAMAIPQPSGDVEAPAQADYYTVVATYAPDQPCELNLDPAHKRGSDTVREFFLGESCAEFHPGLARMTGWSIDRSGAIRLLGPGQETLGVFSKDADGAYTGAVAGAVYRLTPTQSWASPTALDPARAAQPALQE